MQTERQRTDSVGPPAGTPQQDAKRMGVKTWAREAELAAIDLEPGALEALAAIDLELAAQVDSPETAIGRAEQVAWGIGAVAGQVAWGIEAVATALGIGKFRVVAVVEHSAAPVAAEPGLGPTGRVALQVLAARVVAASAAVVSAVAEGGGERRF